MQFDPMKAGIAGLACGAAFLLAACSGGSSPAASSGNTKAPTSAAASTAPSAGGAEGAACQRFHSDAVDFAGNIKDAGTDTTVIGAAYGGFVPPIELDQSGTEGTPLNGQFDTLIAALQKFASDEASGGNPSNADVISAEKAVFTTCQGVDPGENWSS